MKILKESFTRKIQLKLSLLLSIRLVVLSLCVFLIALDVQAQTEKQISYPVSVPIERAAVSSAPSAPVVKAPAPVIRPLDEAATPPVRAKTPVKKTVKTSAEKKPVTKAVAKTTNKKTSAAKTSTAKTAKKPTAKATSKPIAKNTKNASVKKPAAKKLATTKPPAAVAKISSAVDNSEKSLTQSPNREAPNTHAINPPELTPQAAPVMKAVNPIQAVNVAQAVNAAPTSHKNSVSHLTVPLAAGAVLASAAVSAEDEQELARSLAEEGEYIAEPDVPETVAPKTPTPAVVATAPASVAAKTALPMSNQREAFVTEFKHYVETKIVPKTPGLALAIIADGKVKVLETYGVRKAGSNSLINADTAFRLASVSKSFAATAAAMMVNDGLIRWDTKVTDVLPNVEFSNPRYGDQITVQHILSQSTGLPTHSGDNYIEEGSSFDEVVRRLRYVNFVCPPGKCYNYQNVSYSLISNIVLKKTGVTYEHYLENKVLRPLGMRTATVGYADYTANNNYAVPHLPTRKGWVPTTVTEHYYRVNPAAGVNASITDMSRWLLAHMGQNPAILSPALLNTVLAKITRYTQHYGSREGVTNSHYGLGWRVFDYRGDKNFVHHGGGVKGFRSEMVFNPELKIGMIILTNGPRLAGSVIFDFLDAYEDEKRGERKKEAAAPVNKKKK